MRAKSRARKKNISLKIMDVAEHTVLSEMQKYNVRKIIHGHTHQPNIHEYTIKNQKAKRYVLSDWHDDAKILQVNSDQTFEMKTLIF